MNFLPKVLKNHTLTSSRSFFISRQNHNVQVEVTPQNALLDNPPVVLVKGLDNGQRVTLWNVYIDDAGLEFSSHAHYIADKDGIVNARNHMSHGGKYQGVFPEGLVSSLHAAPPTYQKKPQLKWARLYKRDVTGPMQYSLNVIDGHISEDNLYCENRPKSLAETKFYRHLMTKGVRRIEIEHEELRGTMYMPSGEGPFPAVLDLFGAESGIKEYRSAMLASYGYASFVLPYYSYKDIPPLKDRINLDYFLKAIDFLSKHPDTSNHGIGVVGSSKGGEIGLTLCSLTDKIKACVTINAYNRTIDIDYFLKGKLYLEKRIVTPDNSNIYINKEGKLMAFAKEDFYHWDSHQILPVDKVHNDCQVLIAAGDDDGGLGYKSATVLKERAAHFNKPNISAIIYPETGHLIDPPFHSHIDAVWNSTILVRKENGERHKGLPHYYGGKSYYTCQAAKDLWKRMLALFHKKLVQDAGMPVDCAKIYPPYS